MDMEDDDYHELAGMIGKYGAESVINAVWLSESSYREEVANDILDTLLAIIAHEEALSATAAGQAVLAHAFKGIEQAGGLM